MASATATPWRLGVVEMFDADVAAGPRRVTPCHIAGGVDIRDRGAARRVHDDAVVDGSSRRPPRAVTFGVMPMPMTTASDSRCRDADHHTRRRWCAASPRATPVRRSIPLSRWNRVSKAPISVPIARASGTGAVSSTRDRRPRGRGGGGDLQADEAGADDGQPAAGCQQRGQPQRRRRGCAGNAPGRDVGPAPSGFGALPPVANSTASADSAAPSANSTDGRRRCPPVWR